MAGKDGPRGWKYIGAAGRVTTRRETPRVDSRAKRRQSAVPVAEASASGHASSGASQDLIGGPVARRLTVAEVAVYLVTGMVALAFLTLLYRQNWALATPVVLAMIVIVWLELRRRR